MTMNVIITGGAGFIGSNLVKRLISENHKITVIDNLSTGNMRFLGEVKDYVEFYNLDLTKCEISSLASIFQNAEVVYHIAANADVRKGWDDTSRDINSNIIATHKIAEAARISDIREIIFTSTGCVYGDSFLFPTPEDHPFPIQTSLYGASKVAAEGILSAYSISGHFNTTVFRFVSVLGSNYHHGHVIDFVRKLKLDPKVLPILGNGNQRKSYINVQDCVEALINLRGENSFEVFNIGQTNYITVFDSARIISEYLGLNPEFKTGTEIRGWIGDNPFTFLDTQKAINFGWYPKFDIEFSIRETVEFLIANQWVLEKKTTEISDLIGTDIFINCMPKESMNIFNNLNIKCGYVYVTIK